MDEYMIPMTGKQAAVVKVTLEAAIPGMRGMIEQLRAMQGAGHHPLGFDAVNMFDDELAVYAEVIQNIVQVIPDLGPHIGAVYHADTGEWRFRHERDDDDPAGCVQAWRIPADNGEYAAPVIDNSLTEPNADHLPGLVPCAGCGVTLPVIYVGIR